MGCKKNFVIKVSQNFGGGVEQWYYYSGTTYTVQGEVFGNFMDDIRNAKDYTSKKRAENAMEKLKIKVGNWSNMMVTQKQANMTTFKRGEDMAGTHLNKSGTQQKKRYYPAHTMEKLIRSRYELLKAFGE